MVQEKTLPKPTQTGPRRYRFNNDEFLKMLEAGYFDQGPRVELIEGEIVEVDAVGPRHGYAVKLRPVRKYRCLANTPEYRAQFPTQVGGWYL